MKRILVIGSLNMDVTINADHMPGVGETIIASDICTNPGGKGANQAYTAGKLGADAAMLGAVGDDEYGRQLIDNLKSIGVDTENILIKTGVSTGLANIVVDKSGDNSIIVIPGANYCVTTADIDEHIECIQAADIVVMQLELDTKVVTYAAKKAKELGKTVILDPAPVKSDIPEELFSYVDIIKPNEKELSMLTGISDVGVEPEAAAQELIKKGVGNVIVSLGEAGVFLCSEAYGSKKFPAYKVNAVDTTAAGDAFTAAVATALSKGTALPDAIDFGQRVSSITVTRRGAQQSIPTPEEVSQLFNNQGG